MKVKELSRTANTAWSPKGMLAIHLACGTVAQQLDATFSTSAKLEIFSLDLGIAGQDMTLVGSVETPHRFHQLVWSEQGMGDSYSAGVIIGGSDNGVITLWNADGIINANPDSLIANINHHTGAVRSLDVNPFQPNLLASGASESEIYIWDLNNPSSPMSPGTKTHPLEDISGVAWNRQVQHIMASTSPGGRSVVWDLRKNEPIIQVADSSSRVQCSDIAWHPDVATQLVTSSLNDHSPVIQMWDLRFATSPMRTLEQHKRGVLSLAWCQQDSDLLLSAAKDNRVLCWNPNSEVPGGEVVYELPSTSQWIFECQWCPRNPSIISTASFDGHVTMYSLLGGGTSEEKGAEPSPVSASPAPSSASFFDGVKMSVAVQNRVVETAPLKTPPKWFRRPCGASFAFGGKLVSFGSCRGAGVPKMVNISSVVTEQEFCNKSYTLENSLSQGRYREFCEGKVQGSAKEEEKNLWNFLKVTFEDNPRRQYLKLLGYDLDELEKKLSTWSKMKVSTLPSAGGLDVNELTNKLATIPVLREEEEGEEERGEEGEGSQLDVLASSETSSTAAVFGSETDRGPGGGGSVFDSLVSSERASKRVSSASFLGVPTTPPSSVSASFFSIPTDRDADGMLAQALLIGNFEAAVDICISADRMAEAMVLAVAGGSDLLKRTQQVFFYKKPSKVSKLISAVVSRNWTDVAKYGDLDNWREILAALVTYAGPEDFATLCDLLGNRLEKEMEGKFQSNASLCYICSGNVEKFVESLSRLSPSSSPDGETQNGVLALQETMEKVVLLRKAVEQQRREYDSTSSTTLNSKLRHYAALLAGQGCLATAYNYIMQDGEAAGGVLKDRLYQAQGLSSNPRPQFPFPLVDIRPPPATSTQAAPSNVMPATKSVMPSDVASNQMKHDVFATRQVTGRSGQGAPGYVNSMGLQGTFVGQPMVNPIPTANPLTSVSNPGIFNPVAPVPISEPPPMPGNMGKPLRPEETTWNDPPLLRNVKQPTMANTIPAPITAPITAPIVAPVQPLPQPSNQGPPATTPNQPAPLPAQKAPPPAVEKPPVPQEHLAMVQGFEDMLARCKGAASNMGTRKKLEDIQRKLSILSDLLREYKVSPNVIQGLNYMAQAASSRDYHSGLACYNQMVSSGNFSEISSFMPGIKMLLNLGNQLKV